MMLARMIIVSCVRNAFAYDHAMGSSALCNDCDWCPSCLCPGFALINDFWTRSPPKSCIACAEDGRLHRNI